MKNYDVEKEYTSNDNVRRCDESKNTGRMTLRDLREFILRTESLPDDIPVVIDRIEDKYFEDNNWCVIDTLFEGHIHDRVLHSDFTNGIPAFAIYVTRTKSKNKVILITPHY